MKKVHVGGGLWLGAHALATSVWAALGIRGSGKSNLAGVIVEGLLHAQIPVVVIDQVGPWFSLRLRSDGKTPSAYQIPVMGGAHGDIPLMPGAGAQVARALAASQSSAVLDISMMSKGERIRFSADFAEAFFEAKKRSPGPVSLVVEESQRLVPQVMRFADPALSRCLGAFEEMAEVGRNFGIGLGLLSLRPQKINKDVLNLTETLFAFRTLGVLERKAIAEWVQEKGAAGRDQVSGELPSLPMGTAIVWSPAVFNVYGRHKLALKTTYDASATPEGGKKHVKITPLDLGALKAEMEQVVKEARDNDPKVLRARISELEKQVAAAESHAGRRLAETKTVKVPVLSESDMKRIEAVVARVDKRLDEWVEATREGPIAVCRLMDPLAKLVHEARDAVRARPDAPVAPPGEWTPRAVARFNGRAGVPATPVTVARERRPSDGDGDRLPAVCQKMLAALRHGEAMGLTQMPWKNVVAIAGVVMSGTTRNRRSTLTSGGYIQAVGPDVRLTDKGRAYPIDAPMPPTDPFELLEYWKREIGTEKVAAMLDFVVRNGEATDDQLAEVAQMEKSGTFRNYKGELTRRGLMVREGGLYRPAQVLRP